MIGERHGVGVHLWTKAGVDYGAMVAEAPKLTAMLEHIDARYFRQRQ